MSILDLSVELVQEIAHMIPSEHKQLRSTCQNLSFAIAPLFFSSVLLDVQQSRLEVGLSHLEALAAGNTQWSQFARTLKIQHLCPAFMKVGQIATCSDDELQLANERFKQVIKPALESLNNIRTVTWNCEGDAESTIETVVNSLGSYSVLEDLRLTAIRANIHFSQLAGLRNLALNTPSDSRREIARSLSQTIHDSHDLESLHVERFDNASFADLFRSLLPTRPLHLSRLHLKELDHCASSIQLGPRIIPHLKFLRSLSWFGGNSDPKAANVAVRQRWDVLREAGMHLTEIRTDNIEEGLLAYLSSYSGLERLCITWAGGKDQDESNRRADEFFQCALPQHTQTLTTLSCRGTYEGRWSFGDHNAGIIAQLRNLRSLRMNVNSVFDGYGQMSPRATTGRGRPKIFKIERDFQGRNMAHRFLELIQLLPIIDAAILPAGAEQHRFATCGNNSIKHKEHVIREIDAAVRTFTASGWHGPSAVVLAGYNYYKMDEGAPRYRPVESANLSWPYSYHYLLGEGK